jgi:hypothetical protein
VPVRALQEDLVVVVFALGSSARHSDGRLPLQEGIMERRRGWARSPNAGSETSMENGTERTRRRWIRCRRKGHRIVNGV